MTPSSVDIFGELGDNITFIGETDAGPGSEYVWLFDPTYSLCIGVSDCSSAALNLFGKKTIPAVYTCTCTCSVEPPI